MELTNELKARFFALYWGQNVAITVDLNCNYPVGIYGGHPTEIKCLELRPLSSITEQELNEIWETIRNGIISEESAPALKNIMLNKDYYHKILRPHECDWLRSKGFLIPFMGIPALKWVEWGVVKLKTE